MNKPYLPCREILEFLADYLDGELTPETHYEFERHLAVCPSCRAYLASYRETIRMARAAALEVPVAEPPEDLVQAIVAVTGRG